MSQAPNAFREFTSRDNESQPTYVSPAHVAGIEAAPDSGTKIHLSGGNTVHVTETPGQVAAALS